MNTTANREIGTTPTTGAYSRADTSPSHLQVRSINVEHADEFLKLQTSRAPFPGLLNDRAQPVLPASTPASEKVGPDAPLRVLVAEDNLVNQMVALMQLKKLGYAADLAVDGLEVLKALEKVAYEVILMDCQMPNMDGWAATREIRRIHARPIRIIAMTGNSTADDCAKCLEAGMDDFLCKPMDTRDLGRIRNFLTRYLQSHILMDRMNTA